MGVKDFNFFVLEKENIYGGKSYLIHNQNGKQVASTSSIDYDKAEEMAYVIADLLNNFFAGR